MPEKHASSPSYDVFFSYARDDEPRAKRIASALVERRLRVWIDSKEIQAADRWPKEIEAGLRASRVYAIMVTRRALASKWVMDEYYAALVIGNSGERPRIVPLVAENVQLPVFLRIRQCVDFRTDEQLPAALQKLEECIRGAEAVEQARSTGRGTPTVIRNAERGYLERALARERRIVRDLWVLRGAGLLLGMIIAGLFQSLDAPGGIATGAGVTLFVSLVSWAASNERIAAAASRENRLLFLRDKLEECRLQWDTSCVRVQREFWRVVHGNTAKIGTGG